MFDTSLKRVLLVAGVQILTFATWLGFAAPFVILLGLPWFEVIVSLVAVDYISTKAVKVTEKILEIYR